MKPKKLIILLLITFFAVLQSSLIERIRVFNIKPDLLLILVVFFSLYFGRTYGLIVGALAGFYTELASGVPAGRALFAYSLLGLLLGHIAKWAYLHPLHKKGTFSQAPAAQALITFVFTFLAYLVLVFLVPVFPGDLFLFDVITLHILPAAGYTAVFAPIVFSGLKIFFNLK